MRLPPSARPPHREIIPLEGVESFAARRFEPDFFPFLWHYHPEVELTLIEQGRGMRLVGDSVEHYETGDLVLLGPDLPHTWSSAPGEGPVRSVVIQFLPAILGQGLWKSPEFRGVARLLESARHGLSAEGPDAPRLRELTRRVIEAPVGSPQRIVRLLDALAALAEAEGLRKLSAHPVRVVTGDDDPADDGPADDALVRRILDRLNRASPRFPSQAQVAREFGLSTWSFSRLFQQHLHKPYSRYVNDWRVQYACRRLVESDDSITRIALDSGFRNLANFHRRFRAAKSMTPRAYRQAALASQKSEG